MPTINGNEIQNGSELKCDVCIIGAGAAGISLALELKKSQLSVILLEAGDWKPDTRTQDLYDGELVEGAVHPGPLYYRRRMFGGSTTVWGGACVPYDEIDFEARDFIPLSGWPFGREELARHYPRACELLEAGAAKFHVSEVFADRTQEILPGFRSDRVRTDDFERNSRPTNFARRYASELEEAPRLRVLLNCNCTRLGIVPEGSEIERVDVATLDGNRFHIAARQVVLATGGLEVARLMLASRDVRPQGIGNENDLVGRYYMCHLSGTAGELQVDGPARDVIHGYELSPEGVYCRRRFAIAPHVQRRLEIGNIILRLTSPPIGDARHGSGPLSALFLAQGMLPYERKKWSRGVDRSARHMAKHVGNVLAHPLETAAFASHVVRKRILASRKYPAVTIKPRSNRYALQYISEQVPLAESRVRLTQQCDALGMPRIHIDWRYDDFDVRTIKTAYQVMAEDLERTGAGRLVFDDQGLEAAIHQQGAFPGHHIGTTRMSDDPTTGVVDANCRVHGLGNLYVASSSVFPTASHANPTLMIVALAVRLGEHLRAHATDGAALVGGVSSAR